MLQPFNRQKRQTDDIFDLMTQQMTQNMGFDLFNPHFLDFDHSIMEFSNIAHQNINQFPKNSLNFHNQDRFQSFPQQGGSYQSYSQCYVQKQKLGPDGKIVKESYFDKSAVARTQNGHTVSERQQGYKNNNGIDKFAHEKLVNDKGRKCIRERDQKGDVNTINHYMNMDENEIDQFESQWQSLKQPIPKKTNQRALPSNNKAFQNKKRLMQ